MLSWDDIASEFEKYIDIENLHDSIIDAFKTLFGHEFIIRESPYFLADLSPPSLDDVGIEEDDNDHGQIIFEPDMEFYEEEMITPPPECRNEDQGVSTSLNIDKDIPITHSPPENITITHSPPENRNDNQGVSTPSTDDKAFLENLIQKYAAEDTSSIDWSQYVNVDMDSVWNAAQKILMGEDVNVADLPIADIDDIISQMNAEKRNEMINIRVMQQDESGKYKRMLSGSYGEDEVVSLITKIRPRFDVVKVSSTGHLADIHAKDYSVEPPITYVIEVKNKTKISYEDVLKYKRDINGMSDVENVVGIFISLETEGIPSIGEYLISPKSIYLSKNYVNEECLNIIFEYAAIYYSNKDRVSSTEIQSIKYEIPSNIYAMASNLRTYNLMIDKQINTLSTTKNSLLQNAKDLTNVIINHECARNIIISVLKELNIPTDDNALEMQHEELKKFIQGTKPSKLSKKMIMERFPLLRSELASLKREEIIKNFA